MFPIYANVTAVEIKINEKKKKTKINVRNILLVAIAINSKVEEADRRARRMYKVSSVWETKNYKL